MADNHRMSSCQRCDCTLAKDYLVAQQECFLCQPRQHTIMNLYRKRIDHQNQFNLTVNADPLGQNSVVTSNNTAGLNGDSDWSFMNNEQTWTEYDQKELLEAEGNPDIDTSMFSLNETERRSTEMEMDYEIY